MVDILPGQDIVGDLGDDRADDLRTERQMGLFRMPAQLLKPFGEEFRTGEVPDEMDVFQRIGTASVQASTVAS